MRRLKRAALLVALTSLSAVLAAGVAGCARGEDTTEAQIPEEKTNQQVYREGLAFLSTAESIQVEPRVSQRADALSKVEFSADNTEELYTVVELYKMAVDGTDDAALQEVVDRTSKSLTKVVVEDSVANLTVGGYISATAPDASDGGALLSVDLANSVVLAEQVTEGERTYAYFEGDALHMLSRGGDQIDPYTKREDFSKEAFTDKINQIVGQSIDQAVDISYDDGNITCQMDAEATTTLTIDVRSNVLNSYSSTITDGETVSTSSTYLYAITAETFNQQHSAFLKEYRAYWDEVTKGDSQNQN